MFVMSVAATKGGVGKTTIAANLGGLLADIGYRVLLIDADVQPSLSRYFALSHTAEHGLMNMVTSGILTLDCISHVKLPPDAYKGTHLAPQGCLHIVMSDTGDGKLQDWLAGRLDTLIRIRMAIQNAAIEGQYDIAIIDTQGAIGHLQDAAVNAADMVISPASPDIISAREFIDGTRKLLERHESVAALGLTVPVIKAVINRIEKTVDSRAMAQVIRQQFLELRGRVNVIETTLPAAVAYRKAATARVPVHWIDTKAGTHMHQLMWELIPSLEGKTALGFEQLARQVQQSNVVKEGAAE